MTAESASPADGRSIDLEVTLPAEPELVWQALTDPRRLASWFPLNAAGAGGAGSTVAFDWGQDAWQTRIDVWEPGRHLRWLDEPMPQGEGGSVQMAVDWYIEGQGGQSVLRLVHSGFGPGSDWDKQIDSLNGGWRYFLECLRHYLAHHRDRLRSMVWLRRRAPMDRAALWRQLEQALQPEERRKALAVGQAYRLQLESGVELRGRLVQLDAPHRLGATVENFNDGHLFVEFEPGERDFSCGIWLSTWGLPPAELERLRQALARHGDRLGLVAAVAVDAAINLLT